jgi:putative glycosyltransferase (TIGR04372 family)
VDHQFVRVGGRQVLIVDVAASDDGHGVGYGIILKRIRRALLFGAAMRMPVFYAREARAINTAVFRLQSPDVEILPRTGWTALRLRAVWLATAPFRFGAPGLWLRRMFARLLLGSGHEALEQARWLPSSLRRVLLRPRRWQRTLKKANSAYARLTSQGWRRTFELASARMREDEARGAPLPLRLSLPPEHEQEAVRDAAAAGLHPTDRLVTVHVRESGYRAVAGLRQRDWDVLRNARIETYQAAFASLVARGYTVVRLGDSTMTPVRQQGVVDLATSAHRTEWLEAWCVHRSQFLIGCDSGPAWLAFLLNVPLLTVNALHFRDLARPFDRVVCKLPADRATGQRLSISQMLTEAYMREGLNTARFDHRDNEAPDLSDAVLDMLDVVRGVEEPSPAQVEFRDRLVDLGRQAKRDWSAVTGITFASQPRGTLSRRFADKYWRAAPAADSGRPAEP